MGLLNKLFGGGQTTPPPFDPNVVVARVACFHTDKHLKPDQKLDLPACRFQTCLGNRVIVCIGYVSVNGRGTKIYAYDLVTGEISEHSGT